jgi:hypothetical protein
LSSGISGRHCAEGLLDLCRPRFDFDIRQRLRRRAASIIFPLYESFPAGVFASRRRNGCAKSFGGSHCRFCPY